MYLKSWSLGGLGRIAPMTVGRKIPQVLSINQPLAFGRERTHISDYIPIEKQKKLDLSFLVPRMSGS
jgi:hypothetical protein